MKLGMHHFVTDMTDAIWPIKCLHDKILYNLQKEIGVIYFHETMPLRERSWDASQKATLIEKERYWQCKVKFNDQKHL